MINPSSQNQTLAISRDDFPPLSSMHMCLCIENIFSHGGETDLLDIIKTALTPLDSYKSTITIAGTLIKLMNKGLDFGESSNDESLPSYHKRLRQCRNLFEESKRFKEKIQFEESELLTDSLSILYLSLSMDLIQLFKIAAKAYGIFFYGKDVALDYIHIHYLLKNFSSIEPIEHFKALDDSMYVKAMYEKVYKYVGDYSTEQPEMEMTNASCENEILEKLLNGIEMNDFTNEEKRQCIANAWEESKSITDVDKRIKKACEFLKERNDDKRLFDWKKNSTNYKYFIQIYMIYEDAYYSRLTGIFLFTYDHASTNQKDDFIWQLQKGEKIKDSQLNVESFNDLDGKKQHDYYLKAVYIKLIAATIIRQTKDKGESEGSTDTTKESNNEEITIDQINNNLETLASSFHQSWVYRKTSMKTLSNEKYSKFKEKDKNRYRVGFLYMVLHKQVKSQNTASNDTFPQEANYHNAARSGSVERIRLFWTEKTQEHYSKMKFPFTPLHWACYKGNLMSLFADHETDDYDLSQCIKMCDQTFTCEEDWTPLMWACAIGDTASVLKLINDDADVNIIDHRGRTILHNITNLHRDTLLKSLLEEKSYSSTIKKMITDKMKDKDGWTIFQRAVCRPGVKTLEILLEKCDVELAVNEQYENDPLFIAVYNGHGEQVDLLLKRQNENNMEDAWQVYKKKDAENKPRDSTLLYVAALRGHHNVIKMILRHTLQISTNKANTKKGTNKTNIEKDNVKKNSEKTTTMKETVRKSYKMLSTEKFLKSSVIWELYMYDNIMDWKLDYEHDELLENADAVNFIEIYNNHFKMVKPFIIDTLYLKLKLRDNEYLIDVKGAYKTDTFQKIIQPCRDSKKEDNTLSLTVFNSFLSTFSRRWFHLTHQFEEEMQVSFYTFEMRRTYELEVLEKFILKLYTYVGLEIFQLEFVKVSVKCAWERYGLYVHLFELFLYIVYSILFSVTNITFNSNIPGNRSSHYYNLVIILLIFTCIMTIFWFLKVLNIYDKDMTQSRYEMHLTTYHTYTEIWTYCLAIGSCITRLIKGFETDVSSAMMSFATLLLYTKIMYFLRPIEATGPLVGMIEMVLLKIRTFLFIMFMVLICFAQSMYLLSWRNDSSGENFGNSSLALVLAFKYMTGQSDYAPAGTFNSAIANIIVIIFAVICTIILLNLLISIISSAYDEISPQANAEWYRQTCKVLMIQPEWLKLVLGKPMYKPRNESTAMTLSQKVIESANPYLTKYEYPPYICYIKRDLSSNMDTKDNKTTEEHVSSTTTSATEIQEQKERVRIMNIFHGLDTEGLQYLHVYRPGEKLDDVFKIIDDKTDINKKELLSSSSFTKSILTTSRNSSTKSDTQPLRPSIQKTPDNARWTGEYNYYDTV